jgi:hypothetical protein
LLFTTASSEKSNRVGCCINLAEITDARAKERDAQHKWHGARNANNNGHIYNFSKVPLGFLKSTAGRANQPTQQPSDFTDTSTSTIAAGRANQPT